VKHASVSLWEQKFSLVFHELNTTLDMVLKLFFHQSKILNVNK